MANRTWINRDILHYSVCSCFTIQLSDHTIKSQKKHWPLKDKYINPSIIMPVNVPRTVNSCYNRLIGGGKPVHCSKITLELLPFLPKTQIGLSNTVFLTFDVFFFAINKGRKFKFAESAA